MRYLLKTIRNSAHLIVNCLIPGYDFIRNHVRRGYGYFVLTMHVSMLCVAGYALSSGYALVTSATKLTVLMFALVYICITSLVGLYMTQNYKYPNLTKSILLAKVSVSLLVTSVAVVSVYVINPLVYSSQRIFASESMPRVVNSEYSVTNGLEGSAQAVSATTLPSMTGQRVNILLIGGDADAGRYGMRTDSLNVVSIDLDTLDTTVIGIPRNLTNAPIPIYLQDNYFYNGYNNLLNALYGWGESHSDDVSASLGTSDYPGASLLSYSVGTLLGIRLDAWVVVNMNGFINVIDALGGLDVYVSKDLKVPGVVSGSKGITLNLTKGWHYMNGTNALSFARSRTTDSDYGRMGRQRCLLTSLVAQKSSLDIALKWPAVAQALSTNVKTNMDPLMLSTLVQLAGKDAEKVKFLSLVPPVIDVNEWNLERIHEIVHYTIYGENLVRTDENVDLDTDAVEIDTSVPADKPAVKSPVVAGDGCKLKP